MGLGMTHHRGPRSGTSARRAIDQLYLLGGTAKQSQLELAVDSQFRSKHRFLSLVIEPLIRFNLIKVSDDVVTLSQAGREFMCPPVKSLSKNFAAAGKKEPLQAKPLDMSKYLAQMPGRSGAFDYRDIPSLMGDKRVAYGTENS